MGTKLLVFVAALLVAAPFVVPYAQVVLTIALAKGLAVMGIVILLQAGQVSFGHALYFAIAAYLTALLSRTVFGGELIVMVAAGILASAFCGLCVGLFVTRYRGIFFGMLNLAFSMIFWSFLEKFYYITGGADGIHLRRPTVAGFALERDGFELALYFGAVTLTVLCAWGSAAFLCSPIGNLFRTIKTNETRLEYLGVSAQRTLLVGYVISAALCGAGGVVMAVAQGIVTPEYAWWIRSAEMVFIAILGGAQYICGAILGVLTYELVRNLASALAADVWQLVLGVFLLVIIVFAPGGLVGVGRDLVHRIAGRTSAPARLTEETSR